MANLEARRRIGWILRAMHREASRKGAAVYRAEGETEGDPFRILVFTMLSARTRDDATLAACGRLFSLSGTPEGILSLGPGPVEAALRGVGFYRVKTKNLLSICRILSGGKVPDTIEGLLSLPGVGRKTANIILARAFGKTALGVDVHVHRISNRLGLVRTRKPEETERALVRLVPAAHLRRLNRDFVAFGQTVCLPRNPRCSECPLNRICMRIGVEAPCPSCAHGK